MAEQKESSVLFSLKELMNLEEDRIRQEEEERQRAVNAEAQARMDAERRAQEQEEARMRAEDERRRFEEQRVREETARVEAIRQGEVERARLDAENAARLEAMRHQQEHERHITALKEDKGKKQITIIAVAVGVLLLFGAVGGGILFKVQSDKQAAAEKRHQAESAAQQAQVDKLMNELRSQNEAVAGLEASVRDAKDEAARRAAEQRLAEAKNQRAATQGRITSMQTPTGTKATTPRAACTCQSGDPLCSCIQ